MIFTGYWEVLVLNFSVMGNTVFFWVKKLMERWYLLVTEKFLFWTFRWWEIRSFFTQKVDEKMIFTWSFWAFYDIPAPGKYVLLRGVNYIIYFCKLKVRSMESAETSFSNFSETINRGVFRTLSSKEDRALCENI